MTVVSAATAVATPKISAGDEGSEQEARGFEDAVGDVAGRELLRGQGQAGQEGRLGRRVSAADDREQGGEDKDDRRRGVERRRRGRRGEHRRHRGAAPEHHRAARVAIAEQAGERRGDRPRQQSDHGDPERPVGLEAVDSERDREAPAGEGDADPGEADQSQVAVVEVDRQRPQDHPQLACASLHRRPQDSQELGPEKSKVPRSEPGT
jgi:hypothetical protein